MATTKTVTKSAAKPALRGKGTEKAKGEVKAKTRTLYRFDTGNGDGVSLIGRMMFYAIYQIQIGGNGMKGDFPVDKPFSMYPGFNSAHYVNKGIYKRVSTGRLSFTQAGADLLKAYPLDDPKAYQAMQNAVKTGNSAGTGRNQKMVPFTVPA